MNPNADRVLPINQSIQYMYRNSNWNSQSLRFYPQSCSWMMNMKVLELVVPLPPYERRYIRSSKKMKN